MKTWLPDNTDEEEDDKEWFWFDKDGKLFRGGEKNGSVQGTVITREYPSDWQKGDEPYYPMNDNRNNKLYAKYKKLAEQEADVIFGGRLGMYKYYDMHNVVEEALNTVDKCLN